MYIRRKVFSSVIDEETGEEKLFSTTEFINEEEYQKEFNSKAMKALRGALDERAGREWYGGARKIFKEEGLGIIKTRRPGARANFKNIGREIQRTDIKDVKTLNGRINRKAAVRDLQKSGNIDDWTANINMEKIIKSRPSV